MTKKRRNPQDANVKQVGKARQNTERRLLDRIRKLEQRIAALERKTRYYIAEVE